MVAAVGSDGGVVCSTANWIVNRLVVNRFKICFDPDKDPPADADTCVQTVFLVNAKCLARSLH